jgi:hypothetical protein
LPLLQRQTGQFQQNFLKTHAPNLIHPPIPVSGKYQIGGKWHLYAQACPLPADRNYLDGH